MNWEDLPAKLTEEYTRSIPTAASAILKGEDGFDHPSLGRVHFKGANWFSGDDPVQPGQDGSRYGSPVDKPNPVQQWFTGGQPLKPAMDAMANVQKPLGGPNPMLSMLLGGALGAGLGYGGGAVASAVLPEKYFDKEKVKKRWAMLGGAAGAAVPAYLWAYPAMRQHGAAGLLKKSEVDDALAAAHAEFRITVEPDELMTKMADAGAAWAPIIPVDRFNRLVLGDPYLTPAMQAATMGLTAGAAASRGGSALVSPMDIGRIAVGMGSGLLSGLVVGKTLGAIAGLKPEAQQQLQQAGMVAGLIRAVVPLAFGQ